MLAWAPNSSQDCNAHAHALSFPFPLSPRSANIHGGSRRHSNYTYMPTNKPDPNATSAPAARDNENFPPPPPLFGSDVPRTNNATTTSNNVVPFSQRQIKRNPLQQPSSASTLQTSRRNAYFRKVSNQRDESRFERRGEDMMRADYLQRQREWEAERAREAEFVPAEMVEEEEEEEEEERAEYGLPSSTSQTVVLQSSMPEAEVEEFLRDEGKELEALLEFLPSAGGEAMVEDDEQEFDKSSLWSDDADYDALFSEVMGQQEQYAGNAAQSSQILADAGTHGEDEMDMS